MSDDRPLSLPARVVDVGAVVRSVGWRGALLFLDPCCARSQRLRLTFRRAPLRRPACVPDCGRARGLATQRQRYRLAVLYRGRTVRRPERCVRLGGLRPVDPTRGTARSRACSLALDLVVRAGPVLHPRLPVPPFPGRTTGLQALEARRLAGRRGVAGDDRGQRALARSPRRAAIRGGRESRRARRRQRGVKLDDRFGLLADPREHLTRRRLPRTTLPSRWWSGAPAAQVVRERRGALRG